MRYFSYDEFDSPDSPGSGQQMCSTFLEMLDQARAYARIPFVITSGYRTAAHNAKVGGVPNSSHTKGYAADIHYRTEKEKARIILALGRAGFARVGVAENFIHVDNDPGKPDAVWTYGQETHVT